MAIKYAEFLVHNKDILNLDDVGVVEFYKKQEIGHDLYKETMKVE